MRRVNDGLPFVDTQRRPRCHAIHCHWQKQIICVEHWLEPGRVKVNGRESLWPGGTITLVIRDETSEEVVAAKLFPRSDDVFAYVERVLGIPEGYAHWEDDPWLPNHHHATEVQD